MRLLALIALTACAPAATPARTPVHTPDHTEATVAAEPTPPIAAKRPHAVTSPNGNRDDPYYWLRDDTRKDPAMLGYLRAEKAYAEAVLAPANHTSKLLLAEMQGRIAAEDQDPPVLENGYWTYNKYVAGGEHPVFARRKGAMIAPEEVVLDGNALATGHDFYSLGDRAISRDGRYVAWADDIVGRRQFVLHIKDLQTGEVLADTATNISPNLVWANDNRTVLYGGKDPNTLREDRVLRHTIGTSEYSEIYREADESYYVSVLATKSRKYLEIYMSATTNSEVRMIDADRPTAAPVVFLPRERDHLYSVDHVAGRFIMRTNAAAKNFRIVEIAEGKQGNRAAWRDLVPARDDQLVEEFAAYNSFVAVDVRNDALRKVLIVGAGGKSHYLEPSESPAVLSVVDTPDATRTQVRYREASLVTPSSTYEVDATGGERALLHRQPVPGYDPSRYATKRLLAAASDGAQIPIAIAYKKDTKLDGSAPLLITGYGSYGFSSDPDFGASRVSLLDRGWVIAVAQVRGGEERGRAWYEAGKLMNKRNTFTDFIAATEALVAAHVAARDQVYATGGSAGGLLMGAVLNLRPDLYRGVVAAVPFVDVVTTMLDESIPLTTNEFDEWGNPKQAAAYAYMLSYSPYDNVKAQAYPSIYVTTGLWDSQVQYFEPAKWVAKLRATKTDHNLLLLDIDMSAGHGGKAGRYERYAQIAREYAFLLMVHDRPDRR